MGRAAEFHQTVTALRKGDQLVLYTDGLIDTGRSQPANLDELEELIRESDPTHRRRLESVWRQLSGNSEPADHDDVSMMVLHFEAGQNQFVSSQEVRETPKHSEPSNARITRGEGQDEIFLCLEGRVTWVMGSNPARRWNGCLGWAAQPGRGT